MDIEKNLAQASKFTVNGVEIRSYWIDHRSSLEVLGTMSGDVCFIFGDRVWEHDESPQGFKFVRTEEQVCARMAQQIRYEVLRMAPT